MSVRSARPRHPAPYLFGLLTIALTPAFSAGEPKASRSLFDLPADAAEASLRRFSEQAGCEVLFATRVTRGVRTNSVKGELSTIEAIDALLADTGLVAVHDQKTGFISVRRETPEETRARKKAAAGKAVPATSENQPPRTQGTMKHRSLLTKIFTAIALAISPALNAAEGTGGVSGSIFNPATGEFVRNAEVRIEGTNLVTYSGDGGTYVLPGVPAGDVTVSVTYTGYKRESATVQIPSNGNTVLNFELRGATFGSSRNDTVVMQQFVVSSEREGNAKAIMEQRAALNIRTVVSADNFGDVTGGNIGEFIKYLPGVVMDYNNSDARAARIGGLDPRYVGVTIDGMNVASAASAAFGANSRQFEFEQASIYGTESIEINKTTTASMDADAPAGRINLRSRNAFDRKGREITAQVTLSANEYAMTLSKRPGPYNSDSYRALPGIVLSYAESFRQRFGIQLSVGANTLYTEQSEVTNTFNFASPDAIPVVQTITFRDAPIINTRASYNLATDFRMNPDLVFSFRTSGSHLDSNPYNRTLVMQANLAQISPNSTLTRVEALPTANANTRIQMNTSRRNKRNTTVSYAPKLEFKRGDLTMTAAGAYSRSRTAYESMNDGYFTNVGTRITRMGWTAERSGTDTLDWNIAQTSGLSWNDPQNYNRQDAYANNVAEQRQIGRSQVWVGQFDALKTFNLILPVRLNAGLKSKLTTFDLDQSGNMQWTYAGPTGSQLAATSTIPTSTRSPFDPKQGGNVPGLNLPRPDPYATFDLYEANPGHFVPNLVNNQIVKNYSSRSIKEQVDAMFLESNTRWRNLRFNLGIRHERTRIVSKVAKVLPNSEVIAAGFTPGTIAFTDYQYDYGRREKRYGEYGNTFLSGGAKYAFTDKLHLQVAASQSISRPSYSNLAGVVTVDTTNQIVRIPNPELKPETSDKYFVSLQYYIEPAGTLSLSGYKLFVADMGTLDRELTPEEAGYGDDPDYFGYTFVRPGNSSEAIRIDGVELEYSQQLVFLPGIWRGLSVFGSLSRARASMRVPLHVPKSANGGVRFRLGNFNAQLRSTWVSSRLNSTNATQGIYQYERIMFDFSGGYKLNNTYEITLTGRNILNSPIATYSNNPGNLRSRAYFGAAWTLGVRGRF